MSGSNMGNVGQFPIPETPFVDGAGKITLPWFYFLQNQYRRTGGSSAGGSVIPVVVGPNPFAYSAEMAGTLFISGGGVSRLQITRDAVTYINTGSFYGAFPLSAGDTAVIHYVTMAPTVVFLPR